METACEGLRSTQNIILMEIFVDFVRINCHIQKLLPRYWDGRMFVTMTFMDFPPMVIKEDLVPKRKVRPKCCPVPDPVFDTGRSGMFSIPYFTCDDKGAFNSEVTLMYPDGCPDRTELGRAYYELAEDLTTVMLGAAFNPEKIPVTRRVREEHYLFDYSNTIIGTLEFFVDSVKIDKHIKAIIPDFHTGQLCVLFKFLDFPPLQICEEKSDSSNDPGPVFKSGRSGLFSVPDITRDVDPDFLHIDIYVLLKYPEDSPRQKAAIGQTTINITQDFAAIILETKCFPEKVPVTRTLRESYLIADGRRKLVGTVSVFIRASCFGNMIVQQFSRCSTNTSLPTDGVPSPDECPQRLCGGAPAGDTGPGAAAPHAYGADAADQRAAAAPEREFAGPAGGGMAAGPLCGPAGPGVRAPPLPPLPYQSPQMGFMPQMAPFYDQGPMGGMEQMFPYPGAECMMPIPGGVEGGFCGPGLPTADLCHGLPDHVCSSLPDGLLDSIGSCLGGGVAVPTGLMESLKQGIAQGAQSCNMVSDSRTVGVCCPSQPCSQSTSKKRCGGDDESLRSCSCTDSLHAVDSEEEGDPKFDEITTEINGAFLTLRVPKFKKKLKETADLQNIIAKYGYMKRPKNPCICKSSDCPCMSNQPCGGQDLGIQVLDHHHVRKHGSHVHETVHDDCHMNLRGGACGEGCAASGPTCDPPPHCHPHPPCGGGLCRPAGQGAGKRSSRDKGMSCTSAKKDTSWLAHITGYASDVLGGGVTKAAQPSAAMAGISRYPMMMQGPPEHGSKAPGPCGKVLNPKALKLPGPPAGGPPMPADGAPGASQTPGGAPSTAGPGQGAPGADPSCTFPKAGPICENPQTCGLPYTVMQQIPPPDPATLNRREKDPDNDIFVLRIGSKKHRETNEPPKRPKLELLLRTPKRQDPEASPSAEAETQYVLADSIIPGEGGEKKPKGKAKKGKKKKK